MADSVSFGPLEIEHEKAVEVVGDLLESVGASRLTSADLVRYSRRPVAVGWRFVVEFSDRKRELDFLVGADFPFDQPRVALVDGNDRQRWPNVEADGFICVLGDHATVRRDMPVDVSKRVIAGATEIIEAGIASDNQEEFRREFRSYWHGGVSDGSPCIISLLDPGAQSRCVSAAWSGRYCVLAETDAALTSWIQRFTGKPPTRIATAPVFRLPEVLLPEEYPRALRDLRKLESRAIGSAPDLFEHSVAKSIAARRTQAIVVLVAPTDKGDCYAGVAINLLGSRASKATRGFRPGHVPARMLVNRTIAESSPVERSRVDRADPAWIHGRERDPRQSVIAQKMVVVVGCGSVGAPVAALLTQAGVGHVILVDHDALEWANVGRHPLGAQSVTNSKAVSMAELLQRNYPHLSIEARNKRLRNLLREEPDLLESADLVVCTTGDFAAEAALNIWQQETDGTPPVVYGWTEAHACAGHAVAVFGSGPCFECGLDELGAPILEATSRPGGEVQEQEPGCAAVFQVYGPTELAHTVTLVAELALDVLLGEVASTEHRVWACSKRFLERSGRTWTKEWLNVANGRMEGAFELVLPWPAKSGCQGCRA